MKTPFGIHAEYVSERAVNNCINMYKKDGHRVKPGLSGEKEVQFFNALTTALFKVNQELKERVQLKYGNQ